MRLIPLKNNVGTWVARHICEQINHKQSTSNEPFVLGLPTGDTPLEMYKELIELHNNKKLDFSNVITFNMDEYVGVKAESPQSYNYFMHENFFKHINIKPENINLLNGCASDLKQECQRYENKIVQTGGIDIFVGGVGVDGHIAFNEAGSSLSSRTRDKELVWSTRMANAKFFDNDPHKVPKLALTIGIATLLDARELIIMAKGKTKARAVHAAIEGSINHLWTVSALQLHPKGIIVIDEQASDELKIKTVNHFKEIENENIIRLLQN